MPRRRSTAHYARQSELKTQIGIGDATANADLASLTAPEAIS
jgi:hypothetical protein